MHNAARKRPRLVFPRSQGDRSFSDKHAVDANETHPITQVCVGKEVLHVLNHSSEALDQSSARSRPFRAGVDDAGALIEASPIIPQKGDTFRALLINLSFSPDKAGARLKTEGGAFCVTRSRAGSQPKDGKSTAPLSDEQRTEQGLC